jgi:hypothetical protein
VVEAAGISTLTMTSALDITKAVKPPRAVFLNFPLGHQTGKPHQPELQSRIVIDAMRAFETISAPGQIVELPYVWDPDDRRWEDLDYTAGWMPERPSREVADAAEEERRKRYSQRP